jgi:integration host factor subunit alpha
MTKSDIVEKIMLQAGSTRKEALELVKTLFGVMKDTVITGEELKISGFGKFKVSKKEDRRGRNPQTGAEIVIESRKVLGFKASTMLKDRINGKQITAT